MTINYFSRRQIDVEKWDDCINSAENSLIYGLSFFLDSMTERWDALVLGDYDAVMPLPIKTRLGFSYVIQPPFTQQLGIFSKLPADPSPFLEKLQKEFRFAALHFNYANVHPDFRQKVNLILPLDEKYSVISSRYRKDLRNNLRQAAKQSLVYTVAENPNAATTIFRSQLRITKDALRRFAALCVSARHHGKLLVREVYSNNTLMAAAVLVRNRNRIYLLLDATSKSGRDISANHFLIDKIVSEFAGSDHTLDFEGSSLPGVAHFYRNFGAMEQPYHYWSFNRLPWPFCFYKRKKYSR